MDKTKRLLKSTFLLFSVSMLTICYGQNNSITTKKIIKKIAKNNYVAAVPEGVLHNESEQYKLYTQLKETATTEELLKYTKHTKPIIRAYAIKCLDDRKYKSLFDLVVEHLHDIEDVNTHSYLERNIALAEYFVSVKNISAIERSKLDSILIFTDNDLDYLSYLLREIGTDNNYYDRIKHLAKTNNAALVALANYQKEEDIPFIENKILKDPSNTIEAIERFPNEAFKATLRVLEYRDENKNTEFAAAVFKDEFAADFLNDLLLGIPKHQREASFYNDYNSNVSSIFKAISQYRDPIFSELFFKIWKEYHIIDSETFNYLTTFDSTKCKKIAIHTLKSPEKFRDRAMVISTMLDFLIKNDPLSAKNLISQNINDSNVYVLKYFIEKAQHFQDSEIIEALFGRLEDTDNGHIYVPIVETILSYENTALNTRLLDKLRDNHNIKDWGLEKITECLNQYGLKM